MDKELQKLATQRDKVIQTIQPEWQKSLRLTASGEIKRSIHNARLFIDNDEEFQGCLAFNEFTGEILKTKNCPSISVKKGAWEDADIALLRSYFDEKYNIIFSRDMLIDAIITVARKETLNPIKKRIESQSWDGKARAERLFIDYLGAEDNHYVRKVTRKWLTGAVARIYHPGIKFELIPVLEGAQGLGKSTVARFLAPEYFNDSLKSLGKQKDDYQQLSGCWIIEIAELAAMKKTELEGVKNFTSASSDFYRNSYGRFASKHPRQCVFIGTTNETDYLRDVTGERRFFPIRCRKLESNKSPWHKSENDVLQILAEVKSWLDSGEPLYLDRRTLVEAKTYQLEAQVENPVKDAIEAFLEMPVPNCWEELSLIEKRNIYLEYTNSVTNTLELKENQTRLNWISNRAILSIVFDKNSDNYLSGQVNNEAKRIKSIIENLNDWKTTRRRTARGFIRGYERVDQ